jgi:ABC-type uncharacterized transport system auxiliary subunit
MQRLTWITSCLLAALFSLVGCTSVPTTHYYAFQPTLTVSLQETENTTTSPFRISVESYEGDVPYQQDRIVFRTSVYEISFYEYHRWLRPPTELVTEQVLKHARASGLFRNVLAGGFDASARYVLDGRVLMFDQWYTGQNRSTVRVGVRYRLSAPELEEGVLWDETIETTADSPNMEILEVIKAFETALHDNIMQAFAAIDRVVAQHTE